MMTVLVEDPAASARETYLAHLRSGVELTGKDVGEIFGRTERWGRLQISKAREEAGLPPAPRGRRKRKRKPQTEPRVGTETETETETRTETETETETRTETETKTETETAFVQVTALASETADQPVSVSRPRAVDRRGTEVTETEIAKTETQTEIGHTFAAWAFTWLAFALGISASVAANVTHSFVAANGNPEIGAVIASAFWPIALYFATEVMARVSWPRAWYYWLARWGGLGSVAVVAGIVSYRHLSGLLTHYGEDVYVATLGPVAVDGLMVIAATALLVMGQGRSQHT